MTGFGEGDETANRMVDAEVERGLKFEDSAFLGPLCPSFIVSQGNRLEILLTIQYWSGCVNRIVRDTGLSAISGKAGGLSEVERLKAAQSVRTLIANSRALRAPNNRCPLLAGQSVAVAKPAGDLLSREVVTDSLNDLQLARSEAQRLGDVRPGVVAEHCGAAQFLVLGAFWFRSHGVGLIYLPSEQKGRELNTPRQRRHEAPSKKARQAAPDGARARTVSWRALENSWFSVGP